MFIVLRLIPSILAVELAVKSSEKHLIIFFILYLLNLLYFILFFYIYIKDTSQEPKFNIININNYLGDELVNINFYLKETNTNT